MHARPPTCYACDALKVSREHAPPKCLFPEKDDLPQGIDLRKNLIRVPSCDAHNSEKSTDDEFLMWVFATQSLGNHYRQLSFHTKAIRAFRMRPFSMLALLENPTPTNQLTQSGQLLPTVRVEIDLARFDSCMTNIAKAIYFKETRPKWKCRCLIFSNLFQGMRGSGSDGLNELHHQAVSAAQSEMAEIPEKGQNPSVFRYRYAKLRPDLHVLLMTYYDDIHVLVKYSEA